MSKTETGHSAPTLHGRQAPFRNFYLLDYFFILLEACHPASPKDRVFVQFLRLKGRHALGESRYKVRLTDTDTITQHKEERIRYTFEQVVQEAETYGLVASIETIANQYLAITPLGLDLYIVYQQEGPLAFAEKLFQVMEQKGNPFRNLIQLMYQANNKRPGVLIFPMYSARLLGYTPSQLRTTKNVLSYLDALVTKLNEDNRRFLDLTTNLTEKNNELITRLLDANILLSELDAPFSTKLINKLSKRVRDFWNNYYLKDVYSYNSSLTSFEVLVYRGEQIGILQATEFFPSFSGRLVYSTAVLSETSFSPSFRSIFQYADTRLYKHHPSWQNDETQRQFTNILVDSYFELKGRRGVFFVNLLALRELVCYSLKIANHVFDDLLNEAYRSNLQGRLRFNISLEVDRLPEETKAMYLKREPVVVDGKPRNIIGIDLNRGTLR